MSYDIVRNQSLRERFSYRYFSLLVNHLFTMLTEGFQFSKGMLQVAVALLQLLLQC